MAYITDTASNYRDLMRRVRRFVTGRAQHGAITLTGTGNGSVASIDTPVGGPSENWTLTATSATTFSVSGSVSAAQGTATVGTPFVGANISLTISAGTVPFVAGDSFTFPVVASTVNTIERWSEDRWTETSNTQEWLAHGPGLAGTDAIYAGIKTYEDTSKPYYFWDAMGHIGYVAGSDFYSQPGRIPVGQYYPGISLSNAAIPFWLVASGRRFVLVAKIGTIYQALYVGFILPYATPSQYPYPLFIGGTMTTRSNRLTSNNTASNRHFIDPGDISSNVGDSMARLRAADGRWISFQHKAGSNPETSAIAAAHIFPYDTAILTNIREAVGGQYPVSPVVLMEGLNGTNNIFGELDGCFNVSGFGNVVENIVQVGTDNYLVVQNVFRTGTADFWALKLA